MARALLVDDDPVMQRYTGHILEKASYEVDTASDAFEAIDRGRQVTYDIVVVDLVLPGPLNGVDVIKEIRKSCPMARIIAYSGFSDEDISEKVSRAGANHFLTKPFKPNDLMELVNSTVEETADQYKLNIQFS